MIWKQTVCIKKYKSRKIICFLCLSKWKEMFVGNERNRRKFENSNDKTDNVNSLQFSHDLEKLG